MSSADVNVDFDTRRIEACLKTRPDTRSVANFIARPDIEKLTLGIDIGELRQALDDCLARESFMGSMQAEGFSALPLTQRPGHVQWTDNDLSGRSWTRADDRYVEEPREDLVPEIEFSEFNLAIRGTYFEYVVAELAKRFPIGRTRVLSKAIYNCNSWHRDPERRLHIPIIINPDSLFVVNHHVKHLPADGSVYFTDTRGYHTAINGGETRRVHVVATLAYPQLTD